MMEPFILQLVYTALYNVYDNACIISRSSFFGSTVAIDAAVEEKEGMGSTQKLQVEVPDVRRTVSA